MACLALASCGSTPAVPVGVVGHVDGFGGLVAADEPRAALIGRDVLSSGGSPSDAVTAMAFAMTATLPSQVGLGASGACLVYDRDKKKTEALDFIAPAGGAASQAARPSAVPALPRGLYALHSRYGRLRWEQLLAPAESMSRLGFPASRALARQLDPVAEPLIQDSGMRGLFVKPDGRLIGEGDMLMRPSLGAALSRLRSRGVGDFYNGAWAREIAASVTAAGGSLTVEDLRNYSPRWLDPIAVDYGNEIAYFTPPPAAAGLLEAEYWTLLAGQGLYARADDAQKPHLMAEVFARGYAARSDWMNPDGTTHRDPAAVLAKARLDSVMAGYSPATHHPAAGTPPDDVVAGTSLLAMDSDGNTTVCAISLNHPFGIGKLAPATGIIPAAAPGVRGLGAQSLGPMLAINKNSNEFRFAAAATGGPTAPESLIGVALSTLIENKPLGQALAAARLFAPGNPDAVFVEPGFSGAGALSARGHQVRETDLPSLVNAARCTSGTPSPVRCTAATDPRGAGLAIIVGEH